MLKKGRIWLKGGKGGTMYHSCQTAGSFSIYFNYCAGGWTRLKMWNCRKIANFNFNYGLQACSREDKVNHSYQTAGCFMISTDLLFWKFYEFLPANSFRFGILWSAIDIPKVESIGFLYKTLSLTSISKSHNFFSRFGSPEVQWPHILRVFSGFSFQDLKALQRGRAVKDSKPTQLK